MEIIRCLQSYLAREVYQTLSADLRALRGLDGLQEHHGTPHRNAPLGSHTLFGVDERAGAEAAAGRTGRGSPGSIFLRGRMPNRNRVREKRRTSS